MNITQEQFNFLKRTAQKLSANQAKPGFGGMFTAESKCGNDDMLFQMYDGGYNQVITSTTFKVVITQSVCNNSTTVRVDKGTPENVSALLKFAENVV